MMGVNYVHLDEDMNMFLAVVTTVMNPLGL
jgi:hypothetical protein